MWFHVCHLYLKYCTKIYSYLPVNLNIKIHQSEQGINYGIKYGMKYCFIKRNSEMNTLAVLTFIDIVLYFKFNIFALSKYNICSIH